VVTRRAVSWSTGAGIVLLAGALAGVAMAVLWGLRHV